MSRNSLKEKWKCIVEPAVVGTAEVKQFEVSKTASMMSSIKGGLNFVPQGHYKALVIEGHGLVMSDTPMEYSTNMDFILAAKGKVLINGLGLGCVLNCIRDSVEHITVIEVNKDVIDLVGPYYPEVEIIHADALTWKPPKGVRYDTVWHDIWPNMCEDNLPEMHRLHRVYGRRCDWQGSWSRGLLEQRRRERKRYESVWV